MTQEITLSQQVSIEKWTGIIKDQKESGLTVADYCEEHGLSWHAYYYWMRKIRRRIIDADDSAGVFAELPISTAKAITPSEPGSIYLHVGSVRLQICGHVDKASLRSLMQVVLELKP